MPSFRKAHKQAEHALKSKLGIGTARNYKQALIRLTQWIQKHRFGDLNYCEMLTLTLAINLAMPLLKKN
jgi:hypothetical protein